MVAELTTHQIRVKVNSFFIPQRSKPNSETFFFAYKISITNMGNEPAKLIQRHWIIKDALDEISEVQGEGVIGEKPRILPGKTYEYTSFCPLDTSYGTMHGWYHFIYDDGTPFIVNIPEFTLFIPALAN